MIRSAGEGDYGQLLELYGAIDGFHADLMPEMFRRFEGPARSSERFGALISDPGRFFFVAQQGDELSGFVNGSLCDSKPYPMFVPRRFVSVSNIFVRESGRGAGIGKALMKEVWSWTRARGAETVRLDVMSANKDAIEFYRRLGFADLRLTMECAHP